MSISIKNDDIVAVTKTISLQSVWSITTNECHVVGNVCYFNLWFLNGLNPSANVQQFASGFPVPKGRNKNFVGMDYDNNITTITIPITIDADGALYVAQPVAFQHSIICSGSYVINS